MADLSRFTALLQKLKLVSIEDEDGDDYRDEAPRGGYQQPRRQQESSLYEDAYARSRGQQARREARQTTRRGGAFVQPQKDNLKPVPRPDTMVYYITQLGECAEVINDILAGTSAVINIDDADDFTAQRIIDTLAGAAFALNAKIKPITKTTYFIAPKNVKVNTSRHIERRY